MPAETEEEGGDRPARRFRADGFAYFLERPRGRRRSATRSSIPRSPGGLAARPRHGPTEDRPCLRRRTSPTGGLTRDHILDNITLYWMTGPGPRRPRSYWENGRPGLKRPPRPRRSTCRPASRRSPTRSGGARVAGSTSRTPTSSTSTRPTRADTSQPGRSRRSSPRRYGRPSARCDDGRRTAAVPPGLTRDETGTLVGQTFGLVAATAGLFALGASSAATSRTAGLGAVPAAWRA